MFKFEKHIKEVVKNCFFQLRNISKPMLLCGKYDSCFCLRLSWVIEFTVHHNQLLFCNSAPVSPVYPCTSRPVTVLLNFLKAHFQKQTMTIMTCSKKITFDLIVYNFIILSLQMLADTLLLYAGHSSKGAPWKPCPRVWHARWLSFPPRGPMWPMCMTLLSLKKQTKKQLLWVGYLDN